MAKGKKMAVWSGIAIVSTAIVTNIVKKKSDKTTYKSVNINPIKKRKKGIYERYIKSVLDIICAVGAIIVFSPVYLGVAMLVKFKLGSPILFTQDRPGLIGADG